MFRSYACRVCLALILCAVVVPSSAHAEAGSFNLHLDGGLGFPLAGAIHPGSQTSVLENDPAFGGGAWLSADWQPKDFSIAPELILGGGAFMRRLPRTMDSNGPFFAIAAGIRARLTNDERGYANDADGNLAGNLWVSAHAGFHLYDGRQFGVDAAVGYELSLFRPISVGMFVRTMVTFGGQEAPVNMMLFAGFSISAALLDDDGPADIDGDGLPDSREAEIGSDPLDEDTDGDLIPDGIEVERGTDPLNTDSDADGLNDGAEDLNRDGKLDPGESDPTKADTDGGGILDVVEMHDSGQNAQDPADDDFDQDGVNNDDDQCPGTDAKAKVDMKGCVVSDGAPSESSQGE